MTEVPILALAQAERFAAVALANIAREYPAKLDHVLAADADAAPPRVLHPAFFGSYDWHSCVHMHWLLARLRRRFPDLARGGEVTQLFNARLASEPIAAELAYLSRPESAAFERTYGWAWLLKLAGELHRHDDADGRGWSGALAPLAGAFANRYLDYLPRAGYAIRHGMHANSAFGLMLAFDFTQGLAPEFVPGFAKALQKACERAALAWYADDRDAPARFEPSGADFLSPSLVEAALMRRILEPRAFDTWLASFLPGIDRREPRTIFEPVSVADRRDPQTVHLDGLNLSRAWCFAEISRGLPADHRLAEVLREASDAHLAAGWSGLASEDYAGGHWLATFALLALEVRHGSA